MPAADKMLATVRRAKELTRETAGRNGAVVRLQNCTEVLVAGDLHGHVPNFQAIYKKADLGNHPTRHLVLQEVIHGKGRYPNGSDKSHQIVDLFAALKCQFPTQVHLLPGNHELAQWTGRPVGKAEDASLNKLFQDGVNTAYGSSFGPSIYSEYLELFKACPLAYRTPNAVYISHSMPPARHMPSLDLSRLELGRLLDVDYQPGGLAYWLLWGRDTADQTVDDFLRKVDADLLVSGHIPTDNGYDVPNHKQLIVDCSASPAAFVLFPADRKLTHAELVRSVVTI